MKKRILGVTTSLSFVALGISVASAAASTYVVRSGDTLSSIAAKNHVTVSSLEAANHLHSTTIYPGQHLVLTTNTSTSAQAAKSKSHSSSSSQTVRTVTVKSGDTLWGLSHTYGVSVTQLEQWNNLSSSSVRAGQELVVHAAAGYASTHKSTTSLGSRSDSFPGDMSAAAERLDIANYARQFVGVPYVWGGESPSGFDCSGFVQYVYRHEGKSIPRTSFDQYNASSPVSYGNLAPGMLVFFNSDGPGASHVGIYLGNGQFISATSRGIQITSLTSGYWADHFVGGRCV